MDLPATQAMNDEDINPTQRFVTEDKEVEKNLVGTLIVANNQHRDQHSIFSGITPIGRHPDCKIVFNDETVSKQHAEIEAESAEKAIFIKDLGSSNRTKINDTKLRAQSSYQIRDNDKLTFGGVTATFKIYRAVDDSFVSCTPQVNRKAKAIIPDTPDSSMNNSSALEGDVSTIPETQPDEDESCFRRPEIPVRTSISNEQKSPKHVSFTLDDVPSPLSNCKDKQNDISEMDTQRFTVNDTKEISDNSIYTAETQKVVIIPRKSIDISEKSYKEGHNRTLNNTSVKKILSEEFGNQKLEDVETQPFICEKSDNTIRNSERTSIFNVETQKIIPKGSDNQSIENLETQPFNTIKFVVDKSDSADLSIHSAPTQKAESENDCLESLETQRSVPNSFNFIKRKSADLSIYSAETQKIIADVSNQSLDNIETQPFINTSNCSKTKSTDIYSAATQKIVPTSQNEAIENLETQQYDNTKYASAEHKSNNISNNSEKNQKIRLDAPDQSIDEIETQPFVQTKIASFEKSKNVSICSASIQETLPDNFNQTGPKIPDDKSLQEVEIQTFLFDQAENKSKENIKTELLAQINISEASSNIESHKIVDEEEIVSSLLLSIEDLEKVPLTEDKLPLDDGSNDIQVQDSKNNALNSDVNTRKLDNNDEVCNSDNENNEKSDSQKQVRSSEKWNKSKAAEIDDNILQNPKQRNKKLSISNSLQNTNKFNHSNSLVESEDEEEIFSQNLIENCPFPLFLDESKNDDNKQSTTDLRKDEEFENKVVVDDNDYNVSLNKRNTSSNVDDKNLNKSKSATMESDNSETDEEGVFSSHLPKENGNIEPDNKTGNDSETDEEGAFSNHLINAENDKTTIESDDDIFNERYDEKRTSGSDNIDNTCSNKINLDSTNTSLVRDGVSKTCLTENNVNNSEDVDELAPTQILETNDINLAPTQIVNTCRPDLEKNRFEDAHDLAPTQLIETQAREYNDMDLAPTQKLAEAQQCTDTLAPTQKLIDTQLCSEEMATLQFTESLTLIVEKELSDVGTEVIKTPETKKILDSSEVADKNQPNISPNTSKRQLEEVEITSNKKLKTGESSHKIESNLDSTVEQNLNEMFEGSEEKIVNVAPLIETQQLENILESSQIEENSITALNVSINKPSPTLSNKRCSIRGKNRRRALMLNKSGSLNDTKKSVVNLNDTIEKNLNELFNNSVDNVETREPEPMLTQQLENVLNSSQDRNPTESKEEQRSSNVIRRNSRLSLSINLNNSITKVLKEKEKCATSSDVQSTSKVIETISQGSLNEESRKNEDYSTNLEDEKDNATNQQESSKNDKSIVYKHGTIGFTDELKPVSTFDRVAFSDKYSSSDSQSDIDDILNLRSLKTPNSKKRVNLRLKNVDLNSSISSTSDQDIEKKKLQSPVLSSKKTNKIHPISAKKRNPVVRLNKLSSPLFRKYSKPAKRVLACGTIGFTEDLQPVENEELVSAASTESEDDLKTKMNQSNATGNVNSAIDEQLPINLPIEDDENNSGDEYLKELPQITIAGTAKCPATSLQLTTLSDHETDNESVKSINFEIPNRWKWYAEKRYDLIYQKHRIADKNGNGSESGNSDIEEDRTDNATVNLVTDNRDDRRAAIDKILAQIEADKDTQKFDTKREAQNDCNKVNNEKMVATRSRKLIKSSTPSPKPIKDDEADNDKTKSDLSSDTDSDSSIGQSFLPKYIPVSPFKINMTMATNNQNDSDDSDQELEALRDKYKHVLTKIGTSPLNMRRRRKSACNSIVKDITQSENIVNKQRVGKTNIGTVDKDGLIFQVSRDVKTTTTTSRMSGSTINRTKRATDDGDESIIQPSPKRTKTEADRTKLQQATVLISPLGDRLLKLRNSNRLNVLNASSNFKQPDTNVTNKRITRVPKTMDSYVIRKKSARTDSSDLSAVESSIIEDKSESKNQPKTKGRLAARNRKAKVDTSSERSANSSKENLEESDVQKPKTRGRGRKNQNTDSSVSDKDSSQDEVSGSSLENKSTRSTRGRLVRQNQVIKKETKELKKESKVIPDSDSELSQEVTTTTRKNTRGRLVKTVEKSDSTKIDVIVKSTEKNQIQDKNDSKSQLSSQPQSVSTRTTRTGRNKVIQESDSVSSDTCDVASSRGTRRRRANDKSDIVVEEVKVDLDKKTMTKRDETKDEQLKEEINIFKLIKKKMSPKIERAVPERKTRTRTAKNATVEESSSEESQEVSKIMENNVFENEKTSTRRRGRATKNNSSHVENTESSDDVFERPTARPKRARITRTDKNKSSQASDAEEDLKPTQLSQKSSTRKKHSPSPSPTLLSDAAVTPSKRSKLSMSPTKRLKVLFTGIESENHDQTIKKLGGVKTEEFEDCSVLVTEKARRTFKFLCSLSRGVPIVSVKWLDDSKQANRFLDLEKYILQDPEAESKFKFNLKQSLDKARNHKLLEGYTVVLAPKISLPPISELKEMVKSSGGKPLLRAPAKWPEKSVVITTEQELESVKKFIAKAPKTVTVQSIEFILTGILRQDINLHEFKLLG